ncbi:kinesin-like protein KIN-4A [Bidens hawaiensis]|uniref:kinesin-like protein KIN-4A n=1 Tax=Bidens hawaiensis TaxID=980011 RepID=UPI00404B0418
MVFGVRGGPSLSPNTRAVRIVSLESKVKSSSTALSKLSSQIQEAGRGHDPASAGRWKALHSLGDAKDLLQHLFSTAIEARRRLLEKEYETKDNRYSGSTATQTTSIQSAKVSSVTKLKELEERSVRTTRDKTPSKKSKALTIGSAPLKVGKAPTGIDIFADIGIEFPLPFPESRELDYKPGICNRPLQVVVKQTQKMIPIAHVPMKKLPLGEQVGKISRWRRSHDEWLIQFTWKWQKPWKLSHLIKTNDQVRKRDDKLKGLDLSLRLGPTTGSSQSCYGEDVQ